MARFAHLLGDLPLDFSKRGFGMGLPPLFHATQDLFRKLLPLLVVHALLLASFFLSYHALAPLLTSLQKNDVYPYVE
jgi:hypothetical protein